MLELTIAVIFFLVGVLMARGYLRRWGYVRITGRVVQIDESERERYKAAVEIPEHGQIMVPYEDSGTYRPGQKVKCMWDGKNESSLSVDYRTGLLIGAIIGIAAFLFVLLHFLLV